MRLSHYLLPPTQSLGSLYKVASGTVPRRSSPVLRQLRATRTMRKTRLVILPGVRSITQIGCLLLFLACPTIAFKGQEKRDVEPMCKFHELKYWWLPFDTGEGKNSTILQKRTGFECQRDDMDITKGNDNVTDSIKHSCGDNTISHGHDSIHGQDENYNFKRNKMWIAHPLPGSVNTEMPYKTIGPYERRTTGRREVPQTMYKAERISQSSQERTEAFNKDQRLKKDRQSSFSTTRGEIGLRTRTMTQNRFQQYRREGSENKGVNERRRLIPLFERRDLLKQTRLSSRINGEFTDRYQNLERLDRQNDQSGRRVSERSSLFTTLERQENKRRATLSLDRKYNSRRHLFNTFIRLDMNRRETQEAQDREERLLNYQRRITSGKRDIRERASSQQDRRERSEQSDKHVVTLISTDKRSKLNRISRDDKSPQQNILQRICPSTLLDSRKNEQRSCSVYRNSNMHQEKSTTDRRIEQRSSPIRLERREISNQSAVRIIQRQTQEEQPRMDRRRESTVSTNSERGLNNRRRPVRSVDSFTISVERRVAESDLQRNIRTRENIPPMQNMLRRLTSLDQRRTSFLRVQPTDSRDLSRIDRRLERAVDNDVGLNLSNRRLVYSNARKQVRDTPHDNISQIQKRSSLELRENIQQSPVTRRLERVLCIADEQRLPNRRVERRVESREAPLDKRIGESNQNRDSRIHERDISRRNISPTQNMLRRINTPELRENTQRSSFIRAQPKDSMERNRIERSLERAVNINTEQRLSNRRVERRVESREFSLDRKTEDPNQNRDSRIHERDISRRNISPTQNMLRRISTSERRENTQRSSFIRAQPKDSMERSRTERSLERAVNINTEQRLSNRRVERRVESREFSLDRKTEDSNQRRDISRANVLPPQNMLRRISSSERREKTHRSPLIRVQPKDSMERNRIERRLERVMNSDNEQRLSDRRRSVRSVESHIFSGDKRMDIMNLRENVRKEVRDISQDNSSPIQQRSRVERRENILQSTTTMIKSENSRTSRSLESLVSINEERRLSNRITERRAEHHDISLDNRIGDSYQRRDIRMNERHISRENDRRTLQNVLQRRSSSERQENMVRLDVNTISNIRRASIIHKKDSTRRITPDILADNRNEIRETQNELQRQRTLSRLGRRETQRAVVTNFQSKLFEEQSRADRRFELVNNKQRMSEKGRSDNSLESLNLSLDRRIVKAELKRNIGISEDYRTRRVRSEILTEFRNEIRENIPHIQNLLRHKSSPLRKESRDATHQSAVIIIQRKTNDELSRMDRRRESAISTSNERSLSDRRRPVRSVDSLERRMAQSDIKRDVRINERENIPPTQNMVRRLASYERREYSQRSSVIRVQPKDSRERSGIDRRLERTVNNEKEHRLSNRRSSLKSGESRVFSLDRRMGMMILQENNRKQERDNSPTQNRAHQRSSLQHRENILLSSATIIKSKDSGEQSGTGRSLESLVSINDERRLFNRRTEHHDVSQDRRIEGSNLRRDIRMHERHISRENVPSLQKMSLRRSFTVRRENTQRSSIIRAQPESSMERSRIERRLQLTVSNDNQQSLPNRGRSVLSAESRVFSLERRMEMTNKLESVRKQVRDTSRDNISPIQQRSSLQRRENILQSPNTITKHQDSKEQSRTGRRLERVVCINDEQRLCQRREERGVESRETSLDRTIRDSNQNRDSRIHERDISRRNISPTQNMLRRINTSVRRENTQRSSFIRAQPKDSMERNRIERTLERAVNIDTEQRLSNRRVERRVESREFSLDRKTEDSNQRRDISRANVLPPQNMLRRISSSERREQTHRCPFTRVEPKDSMERNRIERRLERAMNSDNEQRLSDRRRSVRSVESRIFSGDRRMDMMNLRENDRKVVRDISQDNSSPIQQRSRVERRENFLQSPTTMIKSENSRTSRSLESLVSINDERRLSNRRAERRVEHRDISPDSRNGDSNQQRVIRINERYISRENVLPMQNVLHRRSLSERRENTQRSSFLRAQPKDSLEQSRIDRRLERAVNNDNEQRSSIRRSARSADSRVFSLDRRMGIMDLPEDFRKHVSDTSRGNSSPLRRRSSLERRTNILFSEQIFSGRENSGGAADSRGFSLDRRIERAIPIDNKSRLLAMRRSVRSRDVSLNRRMAESRLGRDARTHEKDKAREESFPRRLQTGSLAQRFRVHKTLSDNAEISVEPKFDSSLRRNKLDSVKTGEDASRFNKRYIQDRRAMLDQRSISERTNVLRLQTLSSERYLNQKLSNSRQRTDVAASTIRISKSDLRLSNVLDMSRKYDEVQILNTRKSASFSPSAIIKAVTGSDVEEILKYSQGFTHGRQIRKLLPDTEITSNDKGHLLQDFVLGSVIAGYFISSIHQKIRDYRNFICIF